MDTPVGDRQTGRCGGADSERGVSTADGSWRGQGSPATIIGEVAPLMVMVRNISSSLKKNSIAATKENRVAPGGGGVQDTGYRHIQGCSCPRTVHRLVRRVMGTDEAQGTCHRCPCGKKPPKQGTDCMSTHSVIQDFRRTQCAGPGAYTQRHQQKTHQDGAACLSGLS